MKDENISQSLQDWSKTLERSSKGTASFLNESIEDSNASKPSATVTEPVISSSKRKRRFSTDTANDLLFWGCHLLIVGISLGIMWLKFDAMNRALKELLKAQVSELEIAKGEIIKADQAYEAARKAEQQRSVDVRSAQNTLTDLVRQVHDNQASIKANQDSIRSIIDGVGQTNQLILAATQKAESAALGSEHAAVEAVGGARAAANAANTAARRADAAAATSGRTANVVASKVVTSGDKAQIRAQQQALARKQQQLSNTIRRVKKTGATFWDKLVH